ncbi:MAG: glycosyltransferase family 4 protein [Candidatus Binatia bacterium]
MSAPVHIAYVCADRGVPVGGRSGASTHVSELTRALVARGAELRIVAVRTRTAEGTPQAAPVIDLNAERLTRTMRHAVFTGAARAQVGAAEVYSLLLNQALSRALERLHRSWRVDAVYERYSLWGYAAAGFACAARLPYLLEVNAPLRQEQRRYRVLENASAAKTIESYLFRMADYVLVPSTQLRTYVTSRGAPPHRVRVVPNAADPARFRRSAPSAARPKGAEFVVGFVGSLKPWHGLDVLVRTFRRLHRLSPAYRLLIGGEGPLRNELGRTLRRYGLQDAVTFCGEVNHEQVPALLARMHVAVAPYPRVAGFYFSPIKVFEYMAAGVPVVASDIGQLGEVLEHRKTALLHRPGAVDQMVAHIERLRRHPALAAQLARQARRLVCRRFTWQRNAGRVLALIAETRREGPAASVRRAAC